MRQLSPNLHRMITTHNVRFHVRASVNSQNSCRLPRTKVSRGVGDSRGRGARRSLRDRFPRNNSEGKVRWENHSLVKRASRTAYASTLCQMKLMNSLFIRRWHYLYGVYWYPRVYSVSMGRILHVNTRGLVHNSSVNNFPSIRWSSELPDHPV